LLQKLSFLLDLGADVNTHDNQRLTPLHVTHSSFAKILIDAGAHVNAQSQTGSTPLHIALTADAFGEIDRGLAEILISSGADINIADNAGKPSKQILENLELALGSEE
jgi:ankyrin repeat protein